jgi:glycosyltransferase involved in cell wall biosynthesis
MDVRVLLSTYRGEGFVADQVRSILRQADVGVGLAVRDDGSTDATLDVIRGLARREPRIDVVEAGANLGVIRSFERLLRAHGGGVPYVAFADQDDVWLERKLAHALERLAALPESEPALYCTRLTYTDAALRPLGNSTLPRRPPCLDNALVENVATGCSIVLNRAAADLLCARPWPASIVMHDWWCYLVVGAVGTVVYDPRPAVLYRQHGRNVVGVGRTPLHRLARRVRGQLRRPAKLCSRQAADLLATYGSIMPVERRERVQRFVEAASGRRRLAYLARRDRAFRQSPLDDLAFRALLLLGRI